MSKSKTRFDTPRTFSAINYIQDAFVLYTEYEKLNKAYKKALEQLDEAGKHVHKILKGKYEQNTD